MTRLLLLECSLYGFKKFYELQKKYKDKKMIIPRIAIKRAFSAIVIVYNEFKESTGLFNFAFYGTMLQEHYHALIRAMAGGVDTLENTMNCISKSNIVFNIQNKLGINHIKRTRLSVGGTHYDPEIHKDDFECEINPLYLIERLTDMSIFGNYQEFDDLLHIKCISFLHAVSEGSLRFTRENRHFYHGRRILSREITNSKEIKYMKEKNDENNNEKSNEKNNENNNEKIDENNNEKIDENSEEIKEMLENEEITDTQLEELFEKVDSAKFSNEIDEANNDLNQDEFEEEEEE